MTLEDFMKICREHGISKATHALDGEHPTTLEFFPVVEAQQTKPDASVMGKPGDEDPELCRCGHGHFAHTNGLCTYGCDVEKCAPPEVK